MRFSKLSVKRKLLLVRLVPLLLAINLVAIVVMVLVYGSQQRLVVQDLQSLTRIVAAQSVASVAFMDGQAAQQNLNVLSNETRIVYACLFSDAGGKRLAHYHKTGGVVDRCPRTESSTYRYSGLTVLLFEPVNWNGKPVGTLYIEAGLRDDIERFIYCLFVLMLCSSVVAFIVYRLTGRWQKQLLKPVIRLADSVDRYHEELRDEAQSHITRCKHDYSSALNTLEFLVKGLEKSGPSQDKHHYHDLRTSLPNDRMFRDRLRKVLSLAKRKEIYIGVVLVELLDVDKIELKFGSEIKDEVLLAVARRMQQGVRETDTVAVLDDPLFAIIQVDIRDEKSVAVAIDRVIQSIHQPIVLDGANLRVECKVAVSVTRGELDVQSLLLQVEKSLYKESPAGFTT